MSWVSSGCGTIQAVFPPDIAASLVYIFPHLLVVLLLLHGLTLTVAASTAWQHTAAAAAAAAAVGSLPG
jgi:hypothetical protein